MSNYYSNKTVLDLIEYYQNEIKDSPRKPVSDQLNSYRSEVEDLTLALKSELDYEQKIKLYLSVYGFVLYIGKNTLSNESKDLITACVQFIGLNFELPLKTMKDGHYFNSGEYDRIETKGSVVVIGSFKRIKPKSYKYILKEGMKGKIWTYYLPQISTFVIKYTGGELISMNGQTLVSERVYMFPKGSILEFTNNQLIYFSDLISVVREQLYEPLTLEAKEMSFAYKNSEHGVKPISLQTSAGELLAIMGASGAGKTTLVNLLSGSIKPNKGQVLLNGVDIHADNQVLEISRLIGLVPQIDLLAEELTVYDNLLYNIHLSRADLTPDQKSELIDKTLHDLDLYVSKDLKVGSAVDKVISGGQRKRLNIALELVRQPSVLLVDEPTSGLSSSDALSVIELLKDIADTGKIVIINIHQPTSDIFYLFDKLLMMDTKGYPTYFGDPFYSATYFKRHLNLYDTAIEDSMRLGYFNPERIIDLMEYKKIDDKGNKSAERVFSGPEWHTKYLETVNKTVVEKKEELPLVKGEIPNRLKQFYIYLKRNVKSRFSDAPYVILSTIGAPLLAFIIGGALRNTDLTTGEYQIIDNVNLIVFLFIGVVIAMFLGMINSAGEIFKDSHLLKRESFLKLSTMSYLLSKTVYLLFLNAFQIGTYVLVSNLLISVNGLNGYHFLLYWMTANTMSMFGLVISARMKTILAIYVLIPFILIPQILFAGALLDFDNIHYKLTHSKYVPIYADLMISRWAYEALVDVQLSKNKYDETVYDQLIEQSTINYHLNFSLLYMNSLIDERSSTDDINSNNKSIRNVLDNINDSYPTQNINKLDVENSDYDQLSRHSKKIKKWLKIKQTTISEKINNTRIKENIDRTLYDNDKLKEFALKKNVYPKYIILDNEMIRKYHPAYFISKNKYSRAHLYAPYKRLGNLVIKTWHFNLMVLLSFMFLFFVVCYKSLKKKG